MTKIYFLLFFVFISFSSFAQDSKVKGDIDGFKLYPNPVVNGHIYIKTAKNGPKQIFIFDIFGTKVLQTTIVGKELNVSDLDSGMYVLRVIEKGKIATRKLIVK